MATRRSYIGQILLLVVCLGVIIFACRYCATAGRRPAPPQAASSGSAVALGSSGPEGALAPLGDIWRMDVDAGVPQDEPRRGVPPRPGVEMVQAAIGRWENADGSLEVSVDPPRPGGGRKPPYHLIVEKPMQMGGNAYGCDFSDPATVHVPGFELLDGYELTFTAWCGGTARGKKKGRGTFIGLSLEDGKLHLAITVDGTAELMTGAMVRRATH